MMTCNKSEISINIFSSKPDKNGHVVRTKTFLINPNINSRSMGYLVGYVQAQNDAGCRVEVV